MDAIASLFSFITTPVSWVIVQFHKVYGALFGDDTGWGSGACRSCPWWSLIGICLIPLFVKQIKSTRAMQALQPEMKEIQERYKNDKQRQSEEMMKLYKETGTNPLSSCLPILAQSPFFFALYHVLNGIATGDTIGVINESLLASARKAHIFGAPLAAKFKDGSATVEALGATVTDVRVVTAVMIILMSASQFYTQRQLMTKNVDTTVKTPFMQQQKMLMYVFRVMFAVFGIDFPVGVLVYWLTTNVWTMGQQMYVIHNNPTPGSKAQAAYLERLTKHVLNHGKARKRSEHIIKAIVAKGRDRNEFERKFINGLNKAGLAAQADGTVVQSESQVAVQTEDGSPASAAASSKRQQPKRQSNSQRQSGAAASGTKAAGEDQSSTPTSLSKSEEPRTQRPRTPSRPLRPRSSPVPVTAARPSPDSARVRSGPSPRPRSNEGVHPVTEGTTSAAAEGADTLTRLEQEGEIAADYLEGLLDIADLDGDIDMDVEADRAAVSIISDAGGRDLQKLVGRDGEVLEALPGAHPPGRAPGDRGPQPSDAGHHRSPGKDLPELSELGAKAAAEVKNTGESVKLKPMTPFERKVVHDAVKAAGLRSESEGEEPQRFVVVLPA
ncbi:Membrane protein insertase YidC [Streptomyces badius]